MNVESYILLRVNFASLFGNKYVLMRIEVFPKDFLSWNSCMRPYGVRVVSRNSRKILLFSQLESYTQTPLVLFYLSLHQGIYLLLNNFIFRGRTTIWGVWTLLYDFGNKTYPSVPNVALGQRLTLAS